MPKNLYPSKGTVLRGKSGRPTKKLESDTIKRYRKIAAEFQKELERIFLQKETPLARGLAEIFGKVKRVKKDQDIGYNKTAYKGKRKGPQNVYSGLLAAKRSLSLTDYDRLNALMQDASLRYVSRYQGVDAEKNTRETLENLYDNISEKNKEMFLQDARLANRIRKEAAIDIQKIIENTGVNLTAGRDAFVRKNVELIKTIREDLLGQVQTTILSYFDGEAIRPLGSMAGAIKKRFKVSDGRARVIARDQLGKTLSQIDQKRQKAAGFTKYMWRSVGDGRVRSRHRFLNGKIFTYGKNPVSGTNGERLPPGRPILCRCIAVAIFE